MQDNKDDKSDQQVSEKTEEDIIPLEKKRRLEKTHLRVQMQQPREQRQRQRRRFSTGTICHGLMQLQCRTQK
jgi:hypothetical protein